MTSPIAVPPDVMGRQTPRILHRPSNVASSAGQEAVELASLAGLDLDPWEQLALDVALGERADGRWAAFEVGVEVARQNGKGAILEARELAGLFLLGERLLIHSAHQFDTSLEAFRRLYALIDGKEEFSRRVKRVSRAHGEEGIELIGGQRIRFRTRTKGGGRGFTGDCVILDEAMEIPEASLAALLPTLSARPNPQVWYTGSAVDKTVHEHGLVFARVRARGIAGKDPTLAYLGWSVDADIDDVADEVLDDPDAWATANPGLGIRISPEFIQIERKSLSARSFGVERLGIGDWPEVDADDQVTSILDLEAWDALLDKFSEVEDPVVFAFDVRPDRSAGSIAVAGRRADGLRHTEIIDHRPGTGWMVARLKRLRTKHKPLAIRYDERSPAAALAKSLVKAGVKAEPINTREYADACGSFFDLVSDAEIRHLGNPPLEKAVRGALTRPLGDAWAWARKASKVDISPLVAATIAVWGHDDALANSSRIDPSKIKVRKV